jgi:hypothetical protein
LQRRGVSFASRRASRRNKRSRRSFTSSMLRFPICAAVCFGLAACGSGEDPAAEAGSSADQLANTIEAVAHVKDPSEATPPRRLGRLVEADLPEEFSTGPSCRLRDGEHLLLVAAAPGAVARIDGRVVRLATAAPAGPSGAYFEAPGITVSIGRRAPLDEPTGSPDRAGITIGGNAERPIEKAEASWTCLR